MRNIQTRSGPEKARACPPHVLQDPPRRRAVRGLLEVADLAHEARALAAPLLLRARKRRDRADALVLEALLSAIGDQLAEIDGAGLALGQIDALWIHGETGGGP
jgi:hypothetical protein